MSFSCVPGHPSNLKGSPNESAFNMIIGFIFKTQTNFLLFVSASDCDNISEKRDFFN